MKIIAVHGKGFAARAIQILTLSKWNHVGLVLPDGRVIDSTFKTGVRIISEEEFRRHYTRTETWNVHVPLEDYAHDFALAQEGKPYDFSALFGLFFQKYSWQEDDKWFCSELLEAILQAGGRVRFRTCIHRILPRETYSVF